MILYVLLMVGVGKSSASDWMGSALWEEPDLGPFPIFIPTPDLSLEDLNHFVASPNDDKFLENLLLMKGPKYIELLKREEKKIRLNEAISDLNFANEQVKSAKGRLDPINRFILNLKSSTPTRDGQFDPKVCTELVIRAVQSNYDLVLTHRLMVRLETDAAQFGADVVINGCKPVLESLYRFIDTKLKHQAEQAAIRVSTIRNT